MRKGQQQPPSLIDFAKIWSKHVLKIKTKSQSLGIIVLYDVFDPHLDPSGGGGGGG